MATAVNINNNAATIAKALKGKKAGAGWSCGCPAHDDRHASLSITEKDGKVLWYCHAGCSQQAVQDALQGRGLLEARAERQERRRHSAASGGAPAAPAKPEAGPLRAVPGGDGDGYPDEGAGPGLGKIVATYDYIDVTGQLLFQVCRFEPKTFRQRRPKGKSWEWGLGNTKPVLFHLLELADATHVWVCEGERDVDNLRALGLDATCNPMGAGKWRDEYGEALAGKHVVI